MRVRQISVQTYKGSPLTFMRTRHALRLHPQAHRGWRFLPTALQRGLLHTDACSPSPQPYLLSSTLWSHQSILAGQRTNMSTLSFPSHSGQCRQEHQRLAVLHHYRGLPLARRQVRNCFVEPSPVQRNTTDMRLICKARRLRQGRRGPGHCQDHRGLRLAVWQDQAEDRDHQLWRG